MSVQGITVIVTLIFAGANCLENKMATSSVEEKQLVVEGMICGLSSDELKNLADHLEIPVMQYVGESKLLISKLVRDKLYEEVGDRSTEADRLTFLGGIENFICGKPPSLEPVGKPKETNESPAQGKRDIIIPKDSSFDISCRANTGYLEQNTPVIFEPHEDCQWPSRLELKESVLSLKQGSASRVRIHVQNITDHDITLRHHTPLGRLEMVRSVTPVEVKLQEPQTQTTSTSTTSATASTTKTDDI